MISRIPRLRTALRQGLPNAAAAFLWLLLAVAFVHRAIQEAGLLDRLLAGGLALVNGLLAMLFVARRQARRTAGLGPFLVALAVTVGPLLLRPSPAPFDWAHGERLRIPGLVLELLSLPWIVASLLSLGPAVGMGPADRGLRTGGTYRIVRHPLYAGELLCSLGYGVGNGSLANGLIWLLLLGGVLLRIHWEERLLADQYPDDYAAYRRQAPRRLLPFLI